MGVGSCAGRGREVTSGEGGAAFCCAALRQQKNELRDEGARAAGEGGEWGERTPEEQCRVKHHLGEKERYPNLSQVGLAGCAKRWESAAQLKR